MADWKTQISYNYNPAYHAYAYGLVYQPGPEQTHGNLSNWGDTGVGADLGNFDPGVTQSYYAAAAASAAASASRTRDESPPGSPENCHYPGSGVVYLGDTQAGRLLLAAPHRAAYDTRAEEMRRAGSDSTSDSEAHTSPDSWSSGGSAEGSLPQADPTTWTSKEIEDEANSRSPDTREEVPNPLMLEPRSYADVRDSAPSSVQEPLPATKKPSTNTGVNPKGKVRAAFSESQMNALVQRFSVQRYLTPAEMKNLAELTGLTYKQVKTWFQNRRMKLRRHQKDTNWVSERYTTNKGSPVHGGAIFSNISPYQGEPRPQRAKEHYNQHMMEAAFKKTAPQNLAFYLATMGSTVASAGYPAWPASSAQNAGPPRPQATGWHMPPGVNHYEFNPNTFTPVDNVEQSADFDGKEAELMNSRSPVNTGVIHDVRQ